MAVMLAGRLLGELTSAFMPRSNAGESPKEFWGGEDSLAEPTMPGTYLTA